MWNVVKNSLPEIGERWGGATGDSRGRYAYEFSEDPAPASTIARTMSSARVIGPL